MKLCTFLTASLLLAAPAFTAPVKPGAGHWEIYTNNLVLRPGAKGEWDAGALGSMTVLKAGQVFHIYD